MLCCSRDWQKDVFASVFSFFHVFLFFLPPHLSPLFAIMPSSIAASEEGIEESVDEKGVSPVCDSLSLTLPLSAEHRLKSHSMIHGQLHCMQIQPYIAVLTTHSILTRVWCVLCVCAVDLFAQRCTGPRFLPNSRHEMCICCSRRLYTVRGRKYRYHGGHICHKCYDRGVRAKENEQQSIAKESDSTRKRRTDALLHSGSLTPDHARKLQDTIHAEHKRGKTRSAESVSRALIFMHEKAAVPREQRPAKESFDVIVKEVAVKEKMSPHSLRTSATRFITENKLVPDPVERLTRKDPLHPLFLETGPSIPQQSLLYQLVKEGQDENRYVSLSTLKAAIFNELGQDIARSTIHTWMKELKIKFGKKKITGNTREKNNEWTMQFLTQYASAWAEQEAGNAVIVWMDESYIHVGLCADKGWYIAGIQKRHQPNRFHGQSKGQRYIIIHAMTKFGMLELSREEPSADLNVPCPSALVVEPFLAEDGSNPEDYHSTMNGVRFCAWMKNRLIPAFKAKFPGKKMILIMDNAGYHKHRGEGWYTPKKMNEEECYNFLTTVANVQQLTDPNFEEGKSPKVYTREHFFKPKKDGGPPLGLQRSFIADYLKDNPNINVEVPKQLLKECLNDSYILFTPAYESWLQPIEMVWAQVKHAVIMQSDRQRSKEQLQQQTKTALRSMTSEGLMKIVDHVHCDISEWLLSTDAGWLSAWKSFELLWRSSPEERHTEYILHHQVKPVQGAAATEKYEVEYAAADGDGGGSKKKRQKNR